MSETRKRAKYTLEFKMEAVRLFKGGPVAVTAKILGNRANTQAGSQPQGRTERGREAHGRNDPRAAQGTCLKSCWSALEQKRPGFQCLRGAQVERT